MSQELCPDCGKPLQMYYSLKCFHCKKPEIDELKRGNLLEAMYWLKNNESSFDYEEFWTYLCDYDYIKGNDSWAKLPVKSENKQMQLFLNHFPTKGTLWEVSW